MEKSSSSSSFNHSASSDSLFGNRRFTVFQEAVQAFSDFQKPGCPYRFFEFVGTGKYPVDTCICWHEYRTLTGNLKASLRYSLLTLSYNFPFSNMKNFLLRFYGAKVHRSVYFSPRIFVDSLLPSLLTIGKGVLVGTNAEISLHEHTGTVFRAGRVNIGEGVTIGACSRIRCGVKIGDFAQISGAAVVLRDVPSRAIVVGNPGRVVGYVPEKA
ncbi:MAG: hypothetical protein HQM08_05955 [Candidatus Riflebacteria bacterium]|nr:hypothetical protein [Candidatus Riflebacteria bacterium]